jgi:hypothetical protein
MKRVHPAVSSVTHTMVLHSLNIFPYTGHSASMELIHPVQLLNEAETVLKVRMTE